MVPRSFLRNVSQATLRARAWLAVDGHGRLETLVGKSPDARRGCAISLRRGAGKPILNSGLLQKKQEPRQRQFRAFDNGVYVGIKAASPKSPKRTLPHCLESEKFVLTDTARAE
jgi:hypothetical protein